MPSSEVVADYDKMRALKITREINEKSKGVLDHFEQLLSRVKNGEVSTDKGISFLEVKYQLLLEYLTSITLLMCRKCAGRSLDGGTSLILPHVVEVRTVLEKMRPIEHKLKYQIDKLVRTASTGAIDQADPLRFKANPANLVSKLDEDNDDSEEESTKNKIYRPPKLAAMHYDGDETERKQLQEERAKRRALSSSMMRELRSEHDDAPEEIHDGADLHRKRNNKDEKDKAAYEEKYFIRKPVTKKEKIAARSVRTISALDDLTRFSDISALTGKGHEQNEDGIQKRKRKGGSGKKSGKKSGSKRIKYH